MNTIECREQYLANQNYWLDIAHTNHIRTMVLLDFERLGLMHHKFSRGFAK